MQENWVQWNPLKGIVGKYDVDRVSMDERGLIIQLYSENNITKKVEVHFSYTLDAYRYTNDSFAFNICGDLSQKYGVDFYGTWSFFKVTNSRYLQWLSEQSCAYSNEFTFTHFSFIGTDSIVDILARYEPAVTFIE